MTGRLVISSEDAPDVLPGLVWPVTTRTELGLTEDGFVFYRHGVAVTDPLSRDALVRLLGAGVAALEEFDRIREEQAA